LFIDTIAALAVIAVGCMDQSFEVGSMDAVSATSGRNGFPNLPGSNRELPSQPQGGSKSADGPLVMGGSAFAGGPTAGTGEPPGVGGAAPEDLCLDGVQDGSESDRDCGGGCAPCAERQHCGLDNDCITRKCISTLCAPSRPSGMALGTAGWRASASNTYPDVDPGVVLDPTAGRTWSSGAYQSAGMWLQIDMLAPQFFFEIDIDSTSLPSDAARRFDLYLSVDGSFGEPARTGVFGSTQTQIRFDEPQYARYIRIVLTESAAKWWSIDAIRVRQ
jgi:hypothetical protein